MPGFCALPRREARPAGPRRMAAPYNRKPVSLTPGTKLGAYDVLAKLGEGGMGEVYRGRDSALHRDVALKVLPAEFMADPDRLMRFRREAQLLAALNHPNIAAIYGFESSSEVPALVLELVDGPTLADRLAGGALPVDEALAIAAQIAEALEAAHAQGIVHRDLKPANVKLRPDGTVKVLDFGLAKALDSHTASGPADLSPTITSPALTRAGIILGTAAYMSPEQARGRAADARSDIWAFGVVLFEMLAGQRVFKGDDVADTLAAVLRGEPPWAALPADTPPSIRRLLRRCLQRDVRRRLQHIGDARLELADADEAEVTARTVVATPARRVWPIAVAAAAIGAAAVGLLGWTRTSPSPERSVTRFSIQVPNLVARVIGTGSSVAVSPDGRSVVYVVSGSGLGLERRRFSDMTAEPIRGTEGGTRPFFSPDSQWIGFFADGKVKRVPAAGGTAVALADVPPNARATWGDDDTIVLARPGLMRLPASGGVVETILEAGNDVGQFYEAEFLPGARAVLVQNRRPPGSGVIEAVELATGERHPLLEGASPKLSPDGDLLFVRDGKIWATKFDASRLAVVGTAVPLVESVGFADGDAGEGGFATSRDGSLVYLAGEASSSLVWLDRQGAATPAWPDELRLRNPRLSPDGRRVAANGTSAADLWVFDLERGARLRLTTDGFNRGSAWSPDSPTHRLFQCAGHAAARRRRDPGSVRRVRRRRHPDAAPRSARTAVGRRLVARRTTPRVRRRSWLLAGPLGAAARRRTPAAGGDALQRARRGDLARRAVDGLRLRRVGARRGVRPTVSRARAQDGGVDQRRPPAGLVTRRARAALPRGRMVDVGAGTAGALPGVSSPARLRDAERALQPRPVHRRLRPGRRWPHPDHSPRGSRADPRRPELDRGAAARARPLTLSATASRSSAGTGVTVLARHPCRVGRV